MSQATIGLKSTLHFGMRSCPEHYDLEWGEAWLRKQRSIDGKVYLIMEEQYRIGRDEAVAGKHLGRNFKNL